MRVYGLDWAGSGQRQVADACECGNEPWGSVKCGEFLDYLQTSQLLKKDSAQWSKKVCICLLFVCMQYFVSHTIGPTDLHPSPLPIDFQAISVLLSKVSKFQHLRLCSKSSTLLVSCCCCARNENTTQEMLRICVLFFFFANI